MKSRLRTSIVQALLCGSFLVHLVTGCATPKINWDSRVGAYSYEQAVLDQGPPDKKEQLKDGTIIADWLTSRGQPHVFSTYSGGYGFRSPGVLYQDYGVGPDSFIRLTFGLDGKLKTWKRVYK